MNNPGVFNLGDVALAAINAATTAVVVTSGTDSGAAVAYLSGFEGMEAATLQANFSYGSSGGTSIKAIIETSVDQASTWIEVARFAFTTASAEKVVNLSGLTPITTVYTPTTLADDTVKDGVLGPIWRARILTVGTYVGNNTNLSLRMNAR